ncbi:MULTISPECIES: peptidoglycan bridge formation glycyltransferase FemA/FemB family protein [Streptomyces]|uniref:Aminoacyltransferase n=1 Tax=Streptomyces cavourensis TaxID=67258 RepID=A0ABY5FAX5_9ACTN|nr:MULTISPECIES: peptidoglycan bridge formation glycyltransferase FemA/FemB family protein [Streptomyces]UTR80769.1 aminoacyltransferase [Streptomyces cavourensis]WST13549.1 aminoacyltransferase [Streptomyces microflavus]SCK26033.1 Lipid II:glycine glycyltransferase (Peptidoglycan interpeptide bridge formation enzyme) [Streptomyces sp. ScaeMP-e48]
MKYRIRVITRKEHLAFVKTRPSVSHLQTPAWGDVKQGWKAESLGWFDAEGHLRGAALVLYRPVPKIKRYLAYLPEGPVIDWYAADLEQWLEPMMHHLRSRHAFSVRMGPPVVVRRWDADVIKAAMAEPRARRLHDIEATFVDERASGVAGRLRAMGWQQSEGREWGGFAPGQPRYVFQVHFAGRTMDTIQRSFNQQWRRNIKKAEKADVKVTTGGYEDLTTFHALYRETAERDGFAPRPLTYFQRMWTALTAEHPDRMRLYLAHHADEVLSAATMLTVGTHAWYSYGGSTSRRRELQPSNAVQWRMMNDTHASGAHIYDLRGITDTLDEDNPLLGLLRFKAGTGGQAAEYLGEWDFPLNRFLHKALSLYLTRR